ncbi:MAG TPA: nucleoside triphosphate pyrophosphohydrolase [Bacteroidota bacterium]|nr:nucleoside triphosphate pyrophosphohydrolase [Bacteroidota bacterium]
MKKIKSRQRTHEENFQAFVGIVRRLRKECPWDREQTHESIRHSLIEETYEAIESIDEHRFDELQCELGDILLHIVLHSVMAEEEQQFTIDDVIESITEKMIRRHPHVFGNVEVSGTNDILRNWEQIKLTEGRRSVLDGVPKNMPALMRAHRIQEKASKVGFDWNNKKDVWKKVEEEMNELMHAERSKKPKHIQEEFGDILFSLVNYARFIGVNSEFALKAATDKFTKRFNKIEEELKRRNKKIGSVPLDELDAIWNQHKKSVRRGKG